MYEVTLITNDDTMLLSTEIVIKSKRFSDISRIVETLKKDYPFIVPLLTDVKLEKEKENV